MPQLRVLQVIDYIKDESGVSSVLMNYYRHINTEEVIFDFLVHDQVQPEVRKEIESKGSRLYTISGLRGTEILHYKTNLDEFFREHASEYKIIHGHVPNAAAFYLTEAKKYGIPIRILHSHNSKAADGLVKKVRNKILMEKGIRSSNIHFACSDVAAQFLFGNTKDVRIIRNAIDLERFAYNETVRRQLRSRYGVTDRKVIGHIGRMVEQKNHRFIIRMAEVVKKRNLKMVFLLIGNGPLENELRAEIEQRKLGDYFIFAGVVHQPQDYLQMMDAFILPSLFEGLPMAGVEAQAAGLPTIVSSNVTDEVMLTEYIYKLPIDQPDAWVHKLETLPWDRMEGSEQIKKKGFDITEEADRLEAIYKELIREL